MKRPKWYVEFELRFSLPFCSPTGAEAISNAMRRKDGHSHPQLTMLLLNLPAAQVGSRFKQLMNKYFLIAFPTALLTIAAIDVINVPHHKEWVEERCPQFIEVIRNVYGFDDEDLDEMDRIKRTNEFLKQKRQLRISFGGSEHIVEATGDESIEAVVRKALGWGDDSLPLTPLFASSAVTILDDSADALDSSNVDIASTESSVASGPSSMAWYQCRKSLWDLSLGDASLSNYVYSRDDFTGLPDFPKFGNLAQYFYSGMYAYGKHSLLCFRGFHTMVPCERMESPSSGGKPATRKDDGLSQRIAVDTVTALRNRILYLETQRLAGLEIDALDREIARLREQVRKLERDHLNKFYFF